MQGNETAVKPLSLQITHITIGWVERVSVDTR
jgi:hypothetical protein